MLDKKAISERFFLCYPDLSKRALARFFRVGRAFVTEWAREGTVPWSKLKYLSDSQAVSWDWILDGMEPKDSTKEAKTPKTTSPKFPKASINRRFLSLFPDMTLTQIAAVLGVRPGTVSEWNRNKSQVPWERLEYAAATLGVRWDWLIDGIEPKLRA